MKKLILVAVIGFVAVSAARGSKWFSYVKSEIAGAKKWADGQVPPEKEISRLRSELKLLDKDLLTVVNQLARERVECEELKVQIADLRGKQGVAKEQLTARAAAITAAEKNGETFVSFGTRTDRLGSAKADLEDGVKRFAAGQKSLEAFEANLFTRERIKEALEKQLDALKNQKAELAGEIDAIEAELAMLKLQQMESKYQTDETRLAKIKESIRELKKKTAIQREELRLMPAVYDAPSIGSTKSVEEIMAPVNGSKPTTAKPAAPVVPTSSD